MTLTYLTQADEQEQQEMLKSLRESNSVIQQASKRSES